MAGTSRFRQLTWREFFVNEGPMYLFVAAWMVTNVAIFLWTFHK